MALCPTGITSCRQINGGLCILCATDIDWKDGAGDHSRCCFFCSKTEQVKEITINGNQEYICDVCSTLEQFQPFLARNDDVPEEVVCFVCDKPKPDAYVVFKDISHQPTCAECRESFFPYLTFTLYEEVRKV